MQCTDLHPVAQVAAGGTPLFLGEPGHLLQRYPALQEAQAATGDQSWAIVPIIGPLMPEPSVLTVAWDRPRTFDRDDRAAFMMVGRLCSSVLWKTRRP